MINMNKKLLSISLLLILSILFSSIVLANDVHLVNSDDWVDVYSGMLYSGLKGERGFFVNSESITPLTQVISKESRVILYQSEISPFIPNLDNQLDSMQYDIKDEKASSNFNFDLDPQTGKYYLVSLGNPRITSSLAPLAIKENAWVFIVDVENVDQIVKRLSSATEVTSVGQFPREVMEKINPYVTEKIVNNDIYKDSEAIADKFLESKNYVLTDGAFIESEFFLTKNPVLLTGSNKMLTQTYDYLISKKVEAVILVGNELSVVGEQIRTKSNKEMSVFVKFGQGDTTNSGQVYALTTFPLPSQRLGLTAQQAIYDPVKKELIITFKNIGNVGVYQLTNLRIMTGDEEIASTADEEITFIAAGELIPVVYPVDIDLASVNPETKVEFYTSFGLGPNELDTFLTMKNRYGPPFALPLTVKEMENDKSIIYIDDIVYYKNMNRVGITITNPGDETVYLTAKIHDMIISGLEETISKEGFVNAGETKKIYIPAKLDIVDLSDNQKFDLTVNYGSSAQYQIKAIKVEQPFKIVSGGRITGFVTGLGEGKPGSWIAVIVLILLLLVVIRVMKNKSKGEGKTPSKAKPVSKKK